VLKTTTRKIITRRVLSILDYLFGSPLNHREQTQRFKLTASLQLV
jgi:hypothetical protein